MQRVVETSLLAAFPDDVWDGVTRMEGVNRELMPLVRMTYPKDKSRLRKSDAEKRTPLFTSTLKLFGILPVGRHHLSLAEVQRGPDGGGHFVESSRTTGMRSWQHRRDVVAEGSGTRVTDELLFEPALFVPLVRKAIALLFRHRHKQLVAIYGSQS